MCVHRGECMCVVSVCVVPRNSKKLSILEITHSGLNMLEPINMEALIWLIRHFRHEASW